MQLSSLPCYFVTNTGVGISATLNARFQVAGGLAVSIDASPAPNPGNGNILVEGSVTAAQFRVSVLNTPPASATDIGTVGEIRITGDHLFICTATNTWKRVALASW